MLSQTAEYALRAVLFIADRDGTPVSVDEIATALDVPRNYLSKTLNRLAAEAVLVSARGRGGGFRLALPPGRLSLLSIVEPFDRVTGERRCLLGRATCSDRTPCPAHHQWREVSEPVAAFFRDRTVADLLRQPGAGTGCR